MQTQSSSPLKTKILYHRCEARAIESPRREKRDNRPSGSVLQPPRKTKIVRIMRFVAALSILWIGYTPTALAQSSDWAVVPVSMTDEISWMHPTADRLGAALMKEGVRVMPPEQAATLFERRGSAPSTKVTDSDIQEWVTRSREAIRHLARGDYATALQELKEAEVLSRKAADELNREQNRAQNVLDTCLYMVRALLETGNRSRAKAQVQECVRIVPRGKPNPHMHPPSVSELYREASAPGLDQMGSLLVNSEPTGCPVRINGVLFGETPFEMPDLYPGDYQVQVECNGGQRGRVHPVTIQAGKAEVFVDFLFDRAVQTEPILRLSYADVSNARRQVSDAQQIAKVLGAGAVVLASVPTMDMMELRVVSGTQQRPGLVRIPTTPSGPTDAVASAAAAALAKGECKDLTGPNPVEIDCKTARAEAPKKTKEKDAPSGWPADRPPRGQWISGLTLASLGTVSLITGYGLFAVRSGIDAPISTTSEQEKWVNLHYYTAVLSATGAGLLVAAMPMVLPYRSKTPWWAWMSGGIGVGLLAASVAVAATAEGSTEQRAGGTECFSQTTSELCTKRGKQVDMSILFGMTSAPLLTMPLVYLLRKEDKKRAVRLNPDVSAGRNGGYLRITGTF